MKRVFILLLLVSLLPGYAFSQDDRVNIDSLLNLLYNTEPKFQSQIFSEIAMEFQDRDTSLMYADSAILFAKVFKNLDEEAEGIRTKGRIYYSSDEDSLAIVNFDLAIQLYEKTRNKSEIIQTYCFIARAYMFMELRDTSYYYLDKAEDIAESIKDKKGLSDVYYHRAEIARRSDEYDQAILFYDKSIVLKEEMGDQEGLADNYGNLGLSYNLMGQFDSGIIQYKRALDLYEDEKNHFDAGRMLLRIGNANLELGNYDLGTEFLKRALKKFEIVGSSAGIDAVTNSLGVIYFTQKLFDKALELFLDALKRNRELGAKREIAQSLNNIGNVYSILAEDSLTSLFGENFQDSIKSESTDKYLSLFGEALRYYDEALEVREELGDEVGVVGCLLNMGIIYVYSGKPAMALEPLQRASELNSELNDMASQARLNFLLGQVYMAVDNYNISLDYLNSALEIANEVGLKEVVLEIYNKLSEVYEKRNDYVQALKYHKLYFATNDSLTQEDQQQSIADMQVKLQTERELNAQKIDGVYQLWEQQKELERIQNRNRTIMLIASLVILFLLAVFAIYVFRALRMKNRANKKLKEQKEEIESQRDEIEAQRDEISLQNSKLEEHKDILEEQKQAITDSIQYASRIQSAILPTAETIQHFLPKHFILYKPRDIVSGDYYWLGTREDKIIVAVVDCTGHGVPGAFMSMLGSSLLNEILTSVTEVSSNEILDELRDRIIIALHQTGKEGEAKDGMDMAICVFDKTKKRVQFSGANNPLYLIRNGELTEIKGDRMPIGISSLAGKPFSKHDIDLKKGDALYIFSDGYVDQFGGPKGKKFMTARFRELLLQIQDKIMFEQKEFLEQELGQWMNPLEKANVNYDQIDDILVIGIKI